MPRQTSKSSSSGNVDVAVVNSRVFAPALTEPEFAALLMPFSDIIMPSKALAVAVSGGADSMALCLLAGRWARAEGVRLVALTVDHGLRAESADEAETVANWLAARDIEHHILTWQGEKPVTGIQAAARQARYHLMASWVQENGAAALMTAHHLEDQIETFLLRAERGSGLDGLACMNPVFDLGGVPLLRPLLATSKNRLRASLLESGQTWLEDPSNQNTSYRRVKMRHLLERLVERQLPPEKIANVIGQFSALRQHLAGVVAVFIDRSVRIYPAGYGTASLVLLRKLPVPILERVLIQLTSDLGGKPYPPRRDRLKRALEMIQSGKISGFTLGGCRFILKDHEIMICRDRRNISAREVSPGDSFRWDGLYDVEIRGRAGQTATLTALGQKGWLEIVEKRPEFKEKSVPYPVCITLPALFDHDGVVEVPGLDYQRGDGLRPDVTIAKLQFKIVKEKKLKKS